ncbi:hypothetical protein GOP47_0017567 [Adiantum capillus-veneris]|uniref:AB hydrolase-1 domain-containing protein n=1 Tax=Adiantum capillus-veneris TaxID=13818 RepID=A0A9D4UFM5_ADICA|nr:hypothetical protein GOP47_0017567 [Adiantum capillus-veneris]
MMSLELHQLHGSHTPLPFSFSRRHLHPQLRLRSSAFFSADLIQRRALFSRILIASMVESASLSALDAPVKGMEKLPYKPEGYNYWDWRNHKVHYVVQGEGPPIVLVHGFGASAFHWRYNIPELAKKFSVYAVDLLGFGWSEKALIDYDANLWKDQVADFIKDIVRSKAVLVGNSVGGFTVLNTAANYPELVSGVALLNASGQFENSESKKEVIEETPVRRLIWNPLRDWARKLAISFAFWQAKQPARIRSVLNNVYIDKTNVDDYLVDSIVHPTNDANAGEVYYRLMAGYLFQPSDITLDKLLAKLSCPLLLLWGDLDPWMGSSKVEKIKSLYGPTSVVRLQAGHCPHDEAPGMVNEALIKWVSSIQ